MFIISTSKIVSVPILKKFDEISIFSQVVFCGNSTGTRSRRGPIRQGKLLFSVVHSKDGFCNRESSLPSKKIKQLKLKKIPQNTQSQLSSYSCEIISSYTDQILQYMNMNVWIDPSSFDIYSS